MTAKLKEKSRLQLFFTLLSKMLPSIDFVQFTVILVETETILLAYFAELVLGRTWSMENKELILK